MRLFTILNQKTQTLGRLVFNFQLKRAGKNKWEATSQQFTQIFYRRSENTGIILSATNQHLAPPQWLSLEVLAQQLHILERPFIYSFTYLNLSHKRNQMCFPSFPWKQLGFIELVLKAWMVKPTRLYQLVKSPGRRSPRQRVFPRMRLIPAPLARMSDETEILTWKQSPPHPPISPCETGAVSASQPERWKTNVPPTCAWWSLATKIRHVA